MRELGLTLHDRAMIALDQVLAFVHSFPVINDSTLVEESISSSQVDISALLTSIRTKYRAACASLGIRPRMMAGSTGEATIQEVNRSI